MKITKKQIEFLETILTIELYKDHRLEPERNHYCTNPEETRDRAIEKIIKFYDS